MSSTTSKSFNESFCTVIEYHLAQTFANSDDKQLKHFWCDGVKMPDDPNQLEVEHISIENEIVTSGWLGVNGQDMCVFKIHLGQQSIRCCLNNLPLEACLPDTSTMNWLFLDEDKKTIQLQLK